MVVSLDDGAVDGSFGSSALDDGGSLSAGDVDGGDASGLGVDSAYG